MKQFSTEQEKFWAEKFGEEYISRNREQQEITNSRALFSKVLNNVKNVNSIIEIGANIGLNLHALRNILPSVELSAIEINSDACNELQKVGNINIYNQSVLDFKSKNKYDFVLSKGVLIHINPGKLNQVYELMYTLSSKYICIVEYYNPTPVILNYRGHTNKLFKRDFAGEVLDKFNDLSLVDYGFVYHRDNQFPQDDLTYFLLEKK